MKFLSMHLWLYASGLWKIKAFSTWYPSKKVKSRLPINTLKPATNLCSSLNRDILTTYSGSLLQNGRVHVHMYMTNEKLNEKLENTKSESLEDDNKQRRMNLKSIIETEASALNIKVESIPNIPTRLHSTVDYNSYLTSIANKWNSDQNQRQYNDSSSNSVPNLLLTIFNFMCNNYNDASKSLKPNITTFNIVLTAFSTSKTLLPKAHQLFQSVKSGSLQTNHNLKIEPNTITYNTLMNAYARHQNVDQVISIFQTQVEQCDRLRNQKQRQISKPNIITINTVLNAYAKSNQPDQAQQLLDSMEETYGISPDVVSYTSVIDAYSKSGDAPKAESLLKLMIQMNNQMNAGSTRYDSSENLKTSIYSSTMSTQPTIQTFNAVLNAWSHSKDRNATQRAESLLKLMVEMSTVSKKKERSNYSNTGFKIPAPNHSSFNTVLNTYSHVGDGLGAEELLDAMMDKNSNLYMSNVKPDLISYNTVMNAFTRSGHLRCHEDVLRIMEKMKDANIKPDVISYTTLINSYAKSREKDAPYQATKVLDEMKEKGIDPNIVTYNAVMNTWVKSGDWGSAARAHELLLEMIESKDIHNPNVRTYTIVIDAYAKSRERDAALRAQELLQYMEKQYELTKDPNVQPNVQTYTAVINAWGRSEEEGKAKRALDVLNKMKLCFEKGVNDKIQPNVYSYNAVLNACAYTYGDEYEKDETFRIACNVFDELRSTNKTKQKSYDEKDTLVRPNHVTYGTFLHICARLMPEGEDMSRRTIVEAIFRKCCQDGQVGSYALNQLWEAAPRDLYWALLEEGGVSSRKRSWGEDETISVSDLPAKWTRNVKERHW